jgi:O-antigen/teichoic acid export membrane protein
MNRKQIIVKNVSLGVLYKVLNMGIVFTTIPLLLNYLEKEQYGIWVTIFSLVNIVFFVDAGIGNGLKTKLTESLSNKNYKLAKTYISTAYISISLISLIILSIGIVIIYSINLNELFNTLVLSNTELRKILLVTLTLVISGFILNLYKSFYYANQQASKVEFALLIYQIIILIFITILLNFFQRSLLLIAFLYGFSNIIIGVIFTILFFRRNNTIKPSIQSFSKEKVKDLMGLSLAFFVIQLCMIVIFTSDNLMITNLIGPKEVANYDIVYKLFQVIITISVITIDPFWALFTDAYQKQDFNWIKKTILKLNKIFLLFILLVVFFYYSSESIIKLWIQRDLNFQENLIFYMSIFILIRVYGIIYMTFLNGIGKVKLQMYLYIFGAIINIPLSIYFVKQLNFGSSGVILGTIISVIGLSVILPIQTFKIIKNNPH